MRNMVNSRSILMMGSLLFLAACQTPEPSIDATGDVQSDGLVEVQNAPFDEAFVKPDIELSSYDSIILSKITISYSPDRDEYRLSDEIQADFVSTFTEILTENLITSSGKALTTTPSPSTLRLNIGIDDVKIHANRDADRGGITYTFAESAGEISISGSLENSTTGELLSRFSDTDEDRDGVFERVDRISATREFKKIMRDWSEIISSGINELSE